jgi:hypothetical protein
MEEKYYAEITVTHKIPLNVIMDFEDNTPMDKLEEQLDEFFDPTLLEDLAIFSESIKKRIVVHFTKPGE